MAGSVNSLQGYSVFSPEFITKVINDIIIDPQTYGMIDKWIPTRDQEPSMGTEIKWDEEIFTGGMTKPADIDASSPMIKGYGARQRKWTPPHFREKARIGGTDLLNMRQLGTLNKLRELGSEVVKWVKYLRVRVDNRIYWFKWRAVQSSAAFNIVSNNVVIPLDYSSVGFHPQPAISWDGVNPVIIDDIIGFISQFRNSACYPREAYFGTTVLQTMLADTALRTLISAQIGYRVNDKNIFNTTPGDTGLVEFMQSMFANIKFNYYPTGPVISLTTVLPNVGGAAVATIVDGDTDLFAVGDSVTVIRPNGVKTTATLTAVGDQSVTGPVATEKGTIIRKRMEFMDSDRFVIFAEMPPGQLGGQESAEFVTVANFHGEGGLSNMQSGVVGRSINKEDEDPPYIDLISSFTGGIVVYHTDGPWCAAKVIF